jgi:hypothetical protein
MLGAHEDRSYLAIVVLLMLVLPLASLLIETREPGLALVGKWWTFWAIGVRLFTAGLRQVAKPAFTAEVIFHATSADSHVVVRELGIANLCIGALGIASLWLPGWRPAAAFVGLLFFGAAGVLHAITRPAGGNEWVAMLSDLWVAAIAAIYLASLV